MSPLPRRTRRAATFVSVGGDDKAAAPHRAAQDAPGWVVAQQAARQQTVQA